MSKARSAVAAPAVSRRERTNSRTPANRRLRGYLLAKFARGSSVAGEGSTLNHSDSENVDSESEEECVFSDENEDSYSDAQPESNADSLEENSLNEDAGSDSDSPIDDRVQHLRSRPPTIIDPSSNSRSILCHTKDDSAAATRITPPPKYAASSHTPPASIPRVRGRGAIGRGMYADADPRGNREADSSSESGQALRQGKRSRPPRPLRERAIGSERNRLYDYRTPSKSPNRDQAVQKKGAQQSSSYKNAVNGKRHRASPSRFPTIPSAEPGVRVHLLHRNAQESKTHPAVDSVVQSDGDTRLTPSEMPLPDAGATNAHNPRRPARDVANLKDSYRQICAYEMDMKEWSQTATHAPPQISVETLRVENNRRLELCFSLIKHDYAIGVKYDIESRLWKNGVYKGIEQLRRSLQAGGAVLAGDVRDEWLRFIESMEALYADAIVEMKTVWTKKWAGAGSRPSPIWHRSLNCIGDLSRYKNMYLHPDSRVPSNRKDWTTAVKSYKEASLLSGNTGLYYNQLAIISMYLELLPDALHYYLRGLTVKVFFPGAKDALFTLFETNRKRYELDTGIAHKYQPADRTRSQGRLQLSFVRLHEIICTKISTEKFPEFLSTFQRNLEKCDHLLMSDTDEDGKLLFQMAAINASMSLVAKFSEQIEGASDVLKECLVSLTMCILNTCVQNCQKNARESHGMDTPIKGQSALIYIEVTLLWIASLGPDWLKYFESPRYAATWASFAVLCNTLHAQMSSGVSEVEALTAILDQRGLLAEDWELQGSLAFQQSHYKNPAVEAIKQLPPSELDALIRMHVGETGGCKFSLSDPTFNAIRMWRVVACARLLTKNSKVLQYSTESGTFKVRQISNHTDAVPSVMQAVADLLLSDEEMEYEPYGCERDLNVSVDTDGHDEDDEALRTLKALREQLNGAVEARSRMLTSQPGKERARVIASGKFVPGKTTVIFDTNIFLHGGKQAEAVIKSRSWVVSIPLVVLTELDGLKNGTDSTSQSAGRAVAFLESEFAGDNNTDRRRNPMLKLQTSKGNFLHDLSIRTESWTTRLAQHERRRNNDDVILQCCLHFQNKRDIALENEPDAACPVVLVTGDVNMKLKARTLGIAVTDRLPFPSRSLCVVGKFREVVGAPVDYNLLPRVLVDEMLRFHYQVGICIMVTRMKRISTCGGPHVF
ncbi:Smg-6, nonsense mediated mRNA decay factor [Geranomyces michiganensis]|nr:Smg-6, nonsense mediated mRNA decay factor [Geranomyces michiganensis]